MAKTRKRPQSKIDHEQRFTLTLWTISIVTGLLLTVQHVFYDRDDVLLRLLSIVIAISLPTFILFWQTHWRLHDVIDTTIDPALIVLSGGLGLVVWAIGWWGMSALQEEVLFEVFGGFRPPSIYLPNNLDDGWIWLVIGDVVLIPLGLTILLWGGLRQQIQNASIWHVILLSGGYLGLFGALLFGQGVSGIVGYGLCGVAAGFVSFYARSAWAGFATHATFMYANRAFLDNLLLEMTFEDDNGLIFSEPYFGIKWLSLVLIASLIAIALIQMIRFRSSPESSEKLSTIFLTSPRWGAIALSVIIFVLLIIDEAQRRG